MATCELVSGDGTLLRAESLEREDDWVVAVHELGRDLDSLALLASLWAEEGPSLLAVDLRGHGASEGEPDPGSIGGDVAAACDFARRRGARHVSLVAVGSSATPALHGVGVDPVEAIVLVSPAPATPEEIAVLQDRRAGKLVLYGAHDAAAAAAAESLRHRCAGWSSTVAFATADQGTELLLGRWGAHAGERIRHFVDEQRHLASLPLRRY
jgi:pimeloyl-ACP methyl ester carboxylesterase